MDQKQFTAILEAQQKVISMITLGDPLPDCLTAICELIESILDDHKMRSSILLLDGEQLRHGAAPSLPKEYCEAIDGVTIGPKVGSCGTAVFTRQQIIVTDIENDPLWADYKELALAHGLRACWSTPIISSKQNILGSFAIYYSEPKSPEPNHLELIERFSQLSSLAIERTLAHDREVELTSQLQHSHEKFSAFTSVMPDLALILEEDGTYTDIYGADESLLYQSSKSLLGKRVTDVLPEEESSAIMTVIDKALNSRDVQVFEYELNVQKGRRIFEGRVSTVKHYLPGQPEKRHVLWMARDITNRKSAEQQVKQLAFYDPLTSLPNRRLLMERLDVMIHKAKRVGCVGALLYLDLDDFKRINDSLGHSAGDQLLIEVAKRLKPNLRESDTLARVGGDEFVILIDSAKDNFDHLCNEAAAVSIKLIKAFEESFAIRNGEYNIGVSIGISIIHGDGLTPDEVLKRADTAMYRTKNAGGRDFAFYDPKLQELLDLRLSLEQDVIEAIKNDQFCAYFQPQVNLDEEVIGAEALIRWIHPEKGIIPPNEFIPVAEQFGLIDALQQTVLKDSCKLIQELDKLQLVDEHFSVAVNISPIQFKKPQLKAELLKTLNHFEIPPRRIHLEITEGMLIEKVDFSIAQMNELKNNGFKFSIDDFGTGYSSLAYLHQLPIDELKVDKSFIDQIPKTQVGIAIVDTIIAMAKNMNFSVIAEGVEDKQQVELLNARNIKAIQGYYYARPMSASEFVAWLAEQKDK